ncbi:MAG: heparinase II/III domain-containing protein, partial [Candidatus Hydrogenedens sp.]
FPSELPDLLQKLEIELREQILEDGGHYERSPMYHLHVFLDLLAVLAILKNTPEFLKETLSRMFTFLENITLSDGDTPLFGDTVHRHLPSSEKVLCVAEKYIPNGNKYTFQNKSEYFPQSGYYLYKNNHNPQFEIVIKAGEAGPSFQLAHAHSDQLSYEFLIEKQRVIVDSGMHGYRGSPFRSFQRSTRAHNTIYIEGEEQLECWSTFRVARRGKVLWTSWKPYKEGQLFAGKYQYFNGTIHFRSLFILPQEGFLCWDWVKTYKQKPIYNLLHLHPSIEVQIINSFVLLQCDKIKISLYSIQNEMIEIVAGNRFPHQGWYSEFFGTADPNPVLVLKKVSAANTLTQSGYWISFNDDATKYLKGMIQQWAEEIGNEILNETL